MLKLHPHRHTARLLPHTHTSYPALALVLILSGLLLVGVSASSWAASPPPAVNPQQGSLGFVGIVPGPPPSTAPTILSPSNGQVFTNVPITVSGTCQAGLLVSLTSQGVFVGSTVCNSHGAYSLLIDLFNGSNSLVAQHIDALNQAGPNSNAVTVVYNPATVNANVPPGAQLFLTSDTKVQGTNPGQDLNWRVSIVGGEAPYAVSFDWGDGQSTLVSRTQAGPVSATHSYAQPGSYAVLIRVTDANGNTALIQVISVVNGQAAAVASTSGSIKGGILLAWPVYLLIATLVLTFWLGERREVFKLEHNGRLAA